MSYKEKINSGFKDFLEITFDGNSINDYAIEEKKLMFLAGDVFGFITYSDYYDKLFSKRMMGVIKVIYNETTFEYIKKNVEVYLTMINMPFLKDRLTGGISMKGARFDDCQTCYVSVLDSVIQNFSEFIKDLIDWFDER